MNVRRKEQLVRRLWGVRPWSRHSLVLLVAGLVYIAIGVAYFNAVVPPDRAVAIQVGLELTSIRGWGVLFFLSGLCAVVSSRWPPFAEKWGYTVLTGLSAGWAAVYGLSIIFSNSPITNLTTFLLWNLVAFLWWAISGLLNPPAVFHGRR